MEPWANIELLDLNVGGASPYDDPMLADDFEVFFAGPAANGIGQDIYSAKPDGVGGYETPVPIAAVNTGRSDTTLWVSGDGLTLLIGRTVGSPSFPELDIFITTRPAKNVSFSDPIEIPEAQFQLINSASDEGLGALSEDGLTLFFTSNRDGDADLFMATRPTPDFTEFDTVTKLAISTDGVDEVAPKLSPDGTVLYYSVRNPAGSPTAPFDIFQAKLTKDGFANPTILTDVNDTASNEDFVPHSDNRVAVFASHRDNGIQKIFRTSR